MRIYIACLSTETNSLSPLPTRLADFEAFYLRRGTATADPPNLMTESLHLWRARAEALGWTVTEGLTAIAEPAGPTLAEDYARLRSDVVEGALSSDADLVLLSLHGAMIAEDEDDCEGDIVSAIRTGLPDSVIGVSLDLHCHPSERLLNAADVVIAFKEYPHDDATPRAAELFDLCHEIAEGRPPPVMRLFDCRMTALILSKTEPMASFVREMRRAEGLPAVRSVSLAHGFPWGDVARAGVKVLVVADDRQTADREAERLGLMLYDMRHRVSPSVPGLGDALAEAVREEAGPIVIADMSDNPGAGAPGDATFVLAALLDAGIGNVASGLYYDPDVVAAATDAGVGASITATLGGKLEPMSGQPISMDLSVMAIRSGAAQHLGPGLEPMGTAVWLRAQDEIDIVVNDLRTQVYHPEAFEQLGIDLTRKRLIVVKSLYHFYAPFARIASRVVLAAPPGRTRPDMAAIPLTARPRDYWPAVPDPLDRDRPKAL